MQRTKKENEYNASEKSKLTSLKFWSVLDLYYIELDCDFLFDLIPDLSLYTL